MSTQATSDVPWLDLADPGFDTNGEQVHAARERSWWARTPYGAAVLRHEQGAALLRDRRFVQGNARWPAQNGIRSGLFHDWWAETRLSLEGEDHWPQVAHWADDLGASFSTDVARRAECDGPGEWLPASGNTGAVSFPLRFTPT